MQFSVFTLKCAAPALRVFGVSASSSLIMSLVHGAPFRVFHMLNSKRWIIEMNLKFGRCISNATFFHFSSFFCCFFFSFNIFVGCRWKWIYQNWRLDMRRKENIWKWKMIMRVSAVGHRGPPTNDKRIFLLSRPAFRALDLGRTWAS